MSIGMTNAIGPVSRAALSNDALYSPVKSVATQSYSVVADDLGKTVYGVYNGNIAITISNAVASALPVGAEIAFLHGYNKDISITIGSEWYLCRPGDAGAKGRTLTCSGSYNLVAVKKVSSAAFVATGNFD